MAIDTSAIRSRRAILTAAAGTLVALAAQALGRPLSASAADGQAVLVGGEYTSSSVTRITNSTNNASVISGVSPMGIGVNGNSGDGFGVNGHSDSGTGVRGNSLTGYGVRGISGSGTAISGANHAVDQPAMKALSHGNNTAVLGFSGASTTPPSTPAKTGVYGYAAQDATSRGVWGRSDGGYGVYGSATSGTAVRGTSTSGIGVRGSSSSSVQPALSAQSYGGNTGVLGFSGPSGGRPPATPARTGVHGYAFQDASSKGVYGRSSAGLGVYGQATDGIGVRGTASSGSGGSFEAATGIALHAKGRVQLERSSGKATIAAGSRSQTVTPGFDLTSSSMVLVTLNGNPGGTTVVQRVAINATADTFSVYLTANAVNDTRFAWLVLV